MECGTVLSMALWPNLTLTGLSPISHDQHTIAPLNICPLGITARIPGQTIAG